MAIDWDDNEDTWYCTVCEIDLEDGDLEDGDHDSCPFCGQ